MTDTDIVDELRRLYAAAPQGEWAAGQIDGSDYILQPDDEYFDRIVCLVDDDRFSNLIIAMHAALPALLDAIDALRWYADTGNYHDPTDVPDHLYRDSGDVLLIRGGGGQRACAALAALERSDYDMEQDGAE